MTELLRSDRLTITTDRTRKQSAAATRFYIATPAHAEPVPAVGPALVLCREIAAVEAKRVLRRVDVLRVQAAVGELENNKQEEK
jgi:hypothetical protein